MTHLVTVVVGLSSFLPGNDAERLLNRCIANRQGIVATAEFECRGGYVRSSTVPIVSLFNDPSIVFLRETREKNVTGTWQTDGIAQKLVQVPDPELWAKEQATFTDPHAIYSSNLPLPATLLWNDAFEIYCNRAHAGIKLATSRQTPISGALRSPFDWTLGRIPESSQEVGGRPLVVRHDFAGVLMESTILERKLEGAWACRQVSYDPAMAYLARFVRSVGVVAGSTNARVRDLTVVKAEARNGSYIPVKYIERHFQVKNFPRYKTAVLEGRPIDPEAGETAIQYFVTTRLDWNPPDIRLPPETTTLDSSGGWVKVTPADASGIGIRFDDAIRAIGQRPYQPSNALPRPMTSAEARELMQPQPRSSGRIIVFACLTILCVAYLVYKRWQRRTDVNLALILGLGLTGACSNASRDVGQLASSPLTAGFKDRYVLHQQGNPAELVLTVTNVSAQPITLTEIRGNCTCTLVDRSLFPKQLLPKGTVGVPVRVDGRDFEPQILKWTFSTDRGLVHVNADVFVIPAVTINPASSTMTLQHGESGACRVTVREVQAKGSKQRELRIRADNQVLVTRESERNVDGPIPGHQFQELVYIVRILETPIGEHSTELNVCDGDGSQSLAKATIQWTTVPFVSTIPRRLYLRAKPARAFVVCSDFDVELVRIISCPESLRAAVTGPREVTITKRDSDCAEGVYTVEVETNSVKQKAVSVAVMAISNTEEHTGDDMPINAEKPVTLPVTRQ